MSYLYPHEYTRFSWCRDGGGSGERQPRSAPASRAYAAGCWDRQLQAKEEEPSAARGVRTERRIFGGIIPSNDV